MFRGDAIKRYGLMDPGLIGDSDWDWQLRFAVADKVAFIKVPAILFRGRKPGSSDTLQWRRFYYTTKIFLRHAIPHWRRLGGPLKAVSAHTKCVSYYYHYFCDAAASRVHTGDRRGAWRAIARALAISPAYAVHDLLKPSSLRSSIRLVLVGKRSNL